MGSTPIGVIALKIPENLEPARAVFSGIFLCNSWDLALDHQLFHVEFDGNY